MNKITRTFLALAFLLQAFGLRAGTIFPVDTLHAYSADCEAVGVCLPIPASDFSNYIIFQNGSPYASSISGCDFDTTITYSYNTLFGLGNLGPYHLDAWSVNGQAHSGMFMNITELVSMLNQWDPIGVWEHDPFTLSIKGGASGSEYSNMEVTVMANNTNSIIGLNFGLLPQGSELQFQEGMNSIIAIDLTDNSKDTLMVLVECLTLLPPLSYFDTIPANGLPYTLCLNNWDFLGVPATIYNACPDESGEFVNFYIDTNSYCVKYQGLKCNGADQACIVACNDLGMCDTTYINIYVDNTLCNDNGRKVVDTLLINFSGVYCIDTTVMPGDIVSIENLCPGDSGESVDFEYDPDTHCVTYTSFDLGLDQACFLLTDQFGNTDTTYICVYVQLPENGIIIDTILLGSEETYCFDTTELAGNIVSIENFCPTLSGQEVEFTIDSVNLCVEAAGLAIGTDTACIVICDDYGICDTTYVYITVVPDINDPCANTLPPVAVFDSASTLLNTPVNIDILENDTLGTCLPVSLALLDQASGGIGPNHGTAMLNINQTVDYVPNLDYCGLDTFQYVLCNPTVCDTGTVVVFIDCSSGHDTIIIFNGFSPNNDGVNEVFKVLNIEKFPDNLLKVFNRWGNLVYETKGYANTWKGTYYDRDLPDGTYFYHLDLGDGRRIFTGHLQIQR